MLCNSSIKQFKTQCVQKRGCVFSSGGPDVFLFVNIGDNAPVYLTSRCFQLLAEPFLFSIIIVQNILIIFTSHVCDARMGKS